MIDWEKVIEGLRHCVEKLDTIVNKSHGFNCLECPYYDACDAMGSLVGLPLLRDALELLDVQSDLEKCYGLKPGGAAYALEQYQELVQAITRNRMSKLTYSAEGILEYVDELNDDAPRVLTLEEVVELPVDDGENAPVWMETRIVNDRGVVTHLEASLLWTVENGWWRRFGPIRSGWEDRQADGYNVTWRCWTAKPTDAQREETPWE